MLPVSPHCQRTIASNRALPSPGGLLLPPPGPVGVNHCQEERVLGNPAALASEAQRYVFPGRGVFSVLPRLPGRDEAALSPEARDVGRPGVASPVQYVGTASGSVSGVPSL